MIGDRQDHNRIVCLDSLLESPQCPLCTATRGNYLTHIIRSKYDLSKYRTPPLRTPQPHPPSLTRQTPDNRQPNDVFPGYGAVTYIRIVLMKCTLLAGKAVAQDPPRGGGVQSSPKARTASSHHRAALTPSSHPRNSRSCLRQANGRR